MALSDLAVYSEYAYTSMTEVLAQQIALFNAASRGAIQLSLASVQGDYSDEVLWKKISVLVRRRNAYGSGAVTPKKLETLVDTMVKVAAGTPPIEIDPGQFRWIQANPQLAGVIIGQQLAGDALADMLNTGIGIGVAAIGNQAAQVLDVTAEAGDLAKMSFLNLGKAAQKFGDRSDAIACWVMHSTPFHGMYQRNLANEGNLFNYGNVAVMQDPLGKLFVVTDSPNLSLVDAAVDYYPALGLVPGAINIQQNNDFDANESTVNGDENIQRSYQAEWSNNFGVLGFAWDKTNGGKSPNDAALFLGTNWDKYASSVKDTAGVLLKVTG
jgi:hypothetical protein